MKDCILYVSDFPALVEHLRLWAPELLDEGSGAPIVVGIARTPAKVHGAELMVYARLREGEDEQWAHIPGVEPWGMTDYEGAGTAQKVYDSVFEDEEKYAIYSRIYPHAPYDIDLDGETITVTPSPWFGLVAGA